MTEQEQKDKPNSARKKADKIIAKYKGIKNKINHEPKIDAVGASPSSHHHEGEENATT